MTYNPGASWSGQEPAFPAAGAAEAASVRQVSVFSPKAIFLVTFLMNVLGGFVLSAINWSRLESPSKARLHVAIGAVIFIGVAVLIAALPIGTYVVLLINLCVAFYLRNATQEDIDAQDVIYAQKGPASAKNIEIINGWAAVGIGVLGTVAMLVLVLLLSTVMG